MNTSNQTILGDEERLGVTLSDKYKALAPLESALKDKVAERGLEVSYDCTANEFMGFKTINYTTYAGLMIVHPLQPEIARYQIIDAAQHNQLVTRPFIEFIESQSSYNKYVMDRVDHKSPFSDLVVLPGSNKLDCVCMTKLELIESSIEDALFKIHPLTYDQDIEKLKSILPRANFAEKTADLYVLMKKAAKIYTSNLSDSALYATIFDKPIEPIDTIQSRDRGSFTHINYHLFMGKDRSWLNQVFSSYRSGVFRPEVDGDWQAKMDSYLDYICDLRKRTAEFFVFGAG